MDDINRAYQILGVTPSMSLEEIEAVYEELLEKYEHQTDENMYYKEKVTEWTEAFDCIIDQRIDMSEHPSYSKDSNHYWRMSLVMVKVIFILIIAVVVIKQLTWSQPVAPTISDDPTLYELSNNFQLSLSKFNEGDDWDWGYYEDGNQWIIIVAIEVSQASEAGALINAYNFHLEDDLPITYVLKDIYKDDDLNQMHYLGTYSEVIPLEHKFGLVFQVPAFEQGEERILYYEHPDGTQHEVGRLIFDVFELEENRGIFI